MGNIEDFSMELGECVENLTEQVEILFDLMDKLEELEHKLVRLSENDGNESKAINLSEIEEEIKLKGWDIIEKLYHPDNNRGNQRASRLFETYKWVNEKITR